MAMPEEIVGLLRSRITFKWPDGHTSIFAARDLRLACRCASCIEEMSGRPILDPKTVPDNVRAKQIDLVGQYAISVHWTDGHKTGIYSFQDLRRRCPCEQCRPNPGSAADQAGDGAGQAGGKPTGENGP